MGAQDEWERLEVGKGSMRADTKVDTDDQEEVGASLRIEPCLN